MLSGWKMAGILLVSFAGYVLLTRYQMASREHQIRQAEVIIQTRTIEQELSPIADNAIGQLHAIEREITHYKEADDEDTDANRTDGSISFDWMY